MQLKVLLTMKRAYLLVLVAFILFGFAGLLVWSGLVNMIQFGTDVARAQYWQE